MFTGTGLCPEGRSVRETGKHAVYGVEIKRDKKPAKPANLA
jgi:hypothetical protein